MFLLPTIWILIFSMFGDPCLSQSTPDCSVTMIASFAPCISYLTTGGSTGSPASSCCRALGSLISRSSECTCLMLTGDGISPLPFNKTSALFLPAFCQSSSVPIFQCNDVSSNTTFDFNPFAGSSSSSSPLPPPVEITAAPSPSETTLERRRLDKPLLIASAVCKFINYKWITILTAQTSLLMFA